MSVDTDLFSFENHCLHLAFNSIMQRVYFENALTPEIVQQGLNQTYSSKQPYTDAMFLTDLIAYLEYWISIFNDYIEAYIQSDQ